MENKNNDRGNSSEQRKKLSYAKEHIKGKKYTVVRPEKRIKYTEPDNNALNAMLGTLTGGHHDTVRRFDNTSNSHNAQVYDTPDIERIQQMQKAQFIQQQLESEQKASVYVAFDGISYQPEKTHENNTYGSQPNTYDNADNAKDVANRSNEISAYPENRNISDDPQLVERLRKAQFIREQLENSTAMPAIMSYSEDDIADATVRPEPRMSEEKEHIPEQHTFGADSTIKSLSSMIPMLSDEQKADIQRSIKQKQYENRLEERIQATETTSVPIRAYNYADYHHNNTSDTANSDVLEEVGTAVSYAQSVQNADAQRMVTKPLTDAVKRSLSHTAQTAVDGTATITQSVSGTYDMQAIPYNIGMILAENEGKKLAYKIAKGEDILVEKEQARVQERMAQSKYRFVEPEKHRPKVEKRESIQEEQKRRFIKNTENKKAEVRREAEHKAKESIYLKANRKEDGLIRKIFGEDKKYHPKGKAAVIAGAGAAVMPILLLVIVVMFICAVFSWMSPHKEKVFDDSTMDYKEQELTGKEVITGYVKVVKDVYDEKQLEILSMISAMNCNHEMLDNKWLKIDENFDIESIIAIEATKKWRELQDSTNEEDSEAIPDNSEETQEDIIYHLTREDFEEVVDMTFNFDARAETRVCDLCMGEQHIEFDPDTGDFFIVTIPCIHKFLMGAGVNNLVSLAGHEGNEYYFFDKVFDKDSETYEEDKMMYDLYKEVLQKKILGTIDNPAHTIVDYSGYSEDYQRMMRVASAHGYTVMGDRATKAEEN
ncbi:MAG: hypothetical protein J6N70_07840 [Oribacterium sp.]|nr:hypothetical protein [Oribacterium sp.]